MIVGLEYTLTYNIFFNFGLFRWIVYEPNDTKKCRKERIFLLAELIKRNPFIWFPPLVSFVEAANMFDY